MTMPNPIDVWDVTTFDAELQNVLAENEWLIRSYIRAENAIEAEYQSSSHLDMRRTNDFASSFLGFKEVLSVLLNNRSIRAWHYTRLTDAEVNAMRRTGIVQSTLVSFQRRLDALKDTGDINVSQAEEIYNASIFHSNQHDVRTGRFWMTSHPLAVDDSGVAPLMACWGGEAAHFGHRSKYLKPLLEKIGISRVIEISVPLCLTLKAYCAAEATISTFSRSLGCDSEKFAFDLCVKDPLPPSSILGVRSEGEEVFAKIAQGYPEDFIDVNIEGWDHL